MTVDDPRQARDDLLLPGMAVYASEENLLKYRDITIPEENFTFSSQAVKEVGRIFFLGCLIWLTQHLCFFSPRCCPISLGW